LDPYLHRILGKAGSRLTQFNPTTLNCNQWADAGRQREDDLLACSRPGTTTGFALWPSKASTFNVGNIPWRAGKGDVVQEYVTAFRAKGLKPGLYYSIWDSTQNNGTGVPLSASNAIIKTQLTELLSNYGEIPFWCWTVGPGRWATEMPPFAEIHDLIKSLQPDILITDHDGIQGPWDADLVMYEEPKGVFSLPETRLAAGQDKQINGTGGNDWFGHLESAA